MSGKSFLAIPVAIGLVLLACAPGRLLGFTPTATPTPSNTPTATATNTPTLTPTATPTPNPRAPVITSVELIEDTTSGSLVVFQRISFTDRDGDAYYVHYELVRTTAGAVEVGDSEFDVASDEQRMGAFITGTWDCGTTVYSVTLQASILDRAGNQSNAWEYTIDCR